MECLWSQTMRPAPFLKTLCDGNRLHLTESKRSGDGPLWDYYSSIAIGGYRYNWPLAEQVALAKRLFPYKRATQWNLTVSNKERLEINAKLMKKGYRNYKGQGYWMPASVKPTAWSIARAAALSLPSTTREEYLLPFLLSAISLPFFSHRKLHDHSCEYYKKGRSNPAL